MNMKKLLTVLLLMALAVNLIAGCAATPVETAPATEIPTEAPQPATEPPTEAPTEPEMDYQALFLWDSEQGAAFCRVSGCTFASPEEVCLYHLFYSGVNNPGSWDSITAEEEALLLNAGFWREMDIQIMPAHLLEAELQTYFGIGLADVTVPANWVYSEETDTYYSNYNDAYLPTVTVTGHTELPDGYVVLHLTVSYAPEHGDNPDAWNAPVDMTLRPEGEGRKIISCLRAE